MQGMLNIIERGRAAIFAVRNAGPAMRSFFPTLISYFHLILFGVLAICNIRQLIVFGLISLLQKFLSVLSLRAVWHRGIFPWFGP